MAAMQAVLTRFSAQLPALSSLVDRIKAVGEKMGYLIAVDGRFGRIRSRQGKILVHTMLNVLLQMTGSLTMKYSFCFAERQMQAEGVALDALGYPEWTANQHDEMQMEVKENEVEVISYRIPLDGWKAEEKREHRDDQGRMWSAPVRRKEHDTSTNLFIVRYYHRAGEIIAEAITKAGEFLKLRCPTAGVYKIGLNWQETH